MNDKLWNISITGSENPSTNAPGRLRPELVGTLTAVGKSYPAAGFTLFYDDMDPAEWPIFIKETWEDVFKKLVKLGLSQTGPSSFSGTNVPDGVTRKIYRQLVKGQTNAIEFGDKMAKQRGRSHSDDFDDEGKHKKHGKK
jgi:hypothetical protein